MKAIEIRNKYLEFFKRHGHAVIPSAPLIPENDPSVLFTTAGMQTISTIFIRRKTSRRNKTYRLSKNALEQTI